MRAALAALFVMIATPALAGEVSPARAAFDSGEYATAVKLGEASGDAEDLAVAAQALIAQRLAKPPGAASDALVDRAITNAKAAIAKDPQQVDARVQQAFAYGLKSRRLSVVDALRAGYGAEGKKLINEALAIRPNDGWAYAMRGGWHFEIVRRGGGMTASMMGASVSEGSKAFDKAIALEPNNPAIALLYGAALLELNADKYEQKASGLLAAASAGKPKDAFEAQMQAEAKRIAGILASKGAAAAAAAVSAKY